MERDMKEVMEKFNQFKVGDKAVLNRDVSNDYCNIKKGTVVRIYEADPDTEYDDPDPAPTFTIADLEDPSFKWVIIDPEDIDTVDDPGNIEITENDLDRLTYPRSRVFEMIHDAVHDTMSLHSLDKSSGYKPVRFTKSFK